MPARPAKDAVTLMTVARAVGVSATTVSNAYNRPQKLSSALDAGEQEGAGSLLANAIVDGLVVWSLPERDPLLRLARERQIPLVIHGGPRLRGVPFVGIDDRAAAA